MRSHSLRIAQIFGRENQLLGTAGWVGRVHRYQATGTGRQPSGGYESH